MRTLSETGWFTNGFFVVTYFQTKPLRLLFVSTSWSFEGGHRRLVLAGGWPAPGASAGGAKGVEYHRISWDISRYLKMSQDVSRYLKRASHWSAGIPVFASNACEVGTCAKACPTISFIRPHRIIPGCKGWPCGYPALPSTRGISMDFTGTGWIRMVQVSIGIQFFCSLVEIAPFCSFAFGSLYLVLPATCRRLS